MTIAPNFASVIINEQCEIGGYFSELAIDEYNAEITKVGGGTVITKMWCDNYSIDILERNNQIMGKVIMKLGEKASQPDSSSKIIVQFVDIKYIDYVSVFRDTDSDGYMFEYVKIMTDKYKLDNITQIMNSNNNDSVKVKETKNILCLPEEDNNYMMVYTYEDVLKMSKKQKTH